jgi:hypothetical protein
LLIELTRGRDQNFNSNVRSNRRTFAAENEGPAQCNVVGEASLRMFIPVIPDEDDGESEFVSVSGSTLQTGLIHKKELRTWTKSKVQPSAPQVADRLKIQEIRVRHP